MMQLRLTTIETIVLKYTANLYVNEKLSKEDRQIAAIESAEGRVMNRFVHHHNGGDSDDEDNEGVLLIDKVQPKSSAASSGDGLTASL